MACVDFPFLWRIAYGAIIDNQVAIKVRIFVTRCQDIRNRLLLPSIGRIQTT
jgi:hypothetical protein